MKNSLKWFNFNKNISYLLINSIIHDQIGDTNTLGAKLSYIYNNTKITMIKNMCKIVFFNRCLNNSINYFGETQTYVDKFLKVSKENIVKIRVHN